MTPFERIRQIVMPQAQWRELVSHCLRKLEGRYLEGETEEPKAFGLVAGNQLEEILRVERILPAKRNVRGEEPFKTYIDRIMDRYAVPSRLSFSERGWVMDPAELKELCDLCDRDGLVVFGTYHMHTMPWKDDPTKETPTLLDSVLARNSDLFSFIVSMVDRDRPGIRAFYEGSRAKEIPIHVKD